MEVAYFQCLRIFLRHVLLFKIGDVIHKALQSVLLLSNVCIFLLQLELMTVLKAQEFTLELTLLEAESLFFGGLFLLDMVYVLF